MLQTEDLYPGTVRGPRTGRRVYYKGRDEWDHHSVVIEEGGVGAVKFGFKVQYEDDIDDIEKKA